MEKQSLSCVETTGSARQPAIRRLHLFAASLSKVSVRPQGSTTGRILGASRILAFARGGRLPGDRRESHSPVQMRAHCLGGKAVYA